jgi:ribosome recycling factor
MMPINQMANVVAEGATTLKITPWDKSQLSDIEKAIQLSDLGIQPSSDGFCLRINLPPMTEERRLDYVKLAKSGGEKAKISVRNARRDFLTAVKQAVKNNLLTEDDDHLAQAEVQKLTDNYIKKIDKLVEDKEVELLKV